MKNKINRIIINDAYICIYRDIGRYYKRTDQRVRVLKTLMQENWYPHHNREPECTIYTQ